VQEPNFSYEGHNPTTQYHSSAIPFNAAHAAERAKLRQGVMHVRIDHFYATMEERFDPTLHGQPFIVGTGTGRPNEPGRVIDVSSAAQRLGLVPGMPLRRAHRLAPRTRFLPASYDQYQPIIQKLKELYRLYSRIVESIPISDAFIDLRGCELPFESPVLLAERLCTEIMNIGLTPLIGIANGKAIAELAAMMSRKDGRKGVLYIPPGREASFVQTLSLSLLLKLRAASTGSPNALPDAGDHLDDSLSQNGYGKDTSRSTVTIRSIDNHASEIEGKSEQIDPVAVAEMIAHLRDFGITTFAQIAPLAKEGLVRRLGRLGEWVYQVANGEDESLVVPDAPPLSQNARVHFQHQADADETCAALRKLSDHLSERLTEQRLKGQSIGLILWPNQVRRETHLGSGWGQAPPRMSEEGEEALTTSEETIGGQMMLSRHTDEADVIAYHSLMLFAHYHRPGIHYQQVQLRIGDIIVSTPTTYYPPSTRTRKLTRKL
jgi:nucleotidyltransferase/DNA polymerase involved in DNA repair